MTPNIRIFVYGTLKRGYRYHKQYCAHAKSIEPGAVWGRLYRLAAGYPALVVPESQILASGSANLIADAKTLGHYQQPEFKYPGGDWDLIEGEVVTFPDPLRNIPPIEKLEGFRPGRFSEYQRVMVAARTENGPISVWTYDGTSLASNGLRSTSWP